MDRNLGVKVFVDGSLAARTAALREPYIDDPATKGQLLYSQFLSSVPVPNYFSPNYLIGQALTRNSSSIRYTKKMHAYTIILQG